MENEESTVTVDTGAESAAVDTGAELQNEMVGDFFVDEGLGSVVDPMGNEQLNEKNEPIRTMEEFKAFQAKKSGQPQQPPTQNAKPAQPAAPNVPKQFDSMFVKNGQPDIDAFSNQYNAFSKIKYSATTMPKATPEQAAAAPSAPVDAAAQIKAEVEKYGKEISQVHLAPIEKAWARLAKQFGGEENIPPNVADALREQYAEQREQVRSLMDAKKDELKDKHFNEQLARKDFNTLRKTSDENFVSVARQLFPNAAPDKQTAILNELLFGYTFKDAAGKDKLIPGYGTDYLNHQFDLVNNGKTLNTLQEWQDAYQKFWVNYASNPNNIALLAKIAYNEFAAAQEPKRRDAYRLQWEKEQAEKLKNNVTQQPQAARGGNAGVPDEGAQQFTDYMKVPQRHL